MNLLQKIQTRQARVAVIGLGYVGLPLAVAFADEGFRVVGIDINQERVDAINAGVSYVQDVPSEQLAVLVNTAVTEYAGVELGSPRSNGHMPPSGQPLLSATTDYDVLHEIDAVIVCVPTPLSKTKDPDVSYIMMAADEIAGRLHPGMLIVLESTTYPGTTEELIVPRLEQAYREQEWSISSLTTHPVGHEFFIAFSPERVDPGRHDFTIRNTPKVIGGVTPHCQALACALYGSIVAHTVPVSSPRVAEMVKLLENTFRAVNIGLVNEIAIMCDRLGVDVWEVIDAAKTKPFGFMPFYPGPGLGGHCIPIDPEYLAWKLKTLNYNARFIQLAAEINFGMPQYVVGKVADALNALGKPLKGSRILILGVAYKADVGDLRESPALDVIHLLLQKGVDVSYHDPYVPHLRVDGVQLHTVDLDETRLQAIDCVVVTTAHSVFEWPAMLPHVSLVVDTRNATRGHEGGGATIVRL